MQLLIDGPEDAFAAILLAHGAGAPMDSDAMNAIAAVLVGVGFKVARFEFAYMAARRQGGRRPPPKAVLLQDEYIQAIATLGNVGPLIIGGKSMGGRVASMVADRLHDEGVINGLLCVGYPFHQPAKPENLRTTHLEHLKTPTLICQGTRDPFGVRDEVEGYSLSERVEILWLEDGDYDLRPRKKLSGFSAADHLSAVASETRDWVERVLSR